MIVRALIASFCCLMLFACTDKSREAAPPKQAAPASGAQAVPPPMRLIYTGGTPTDEVKNIVIRYNDLLVFGYANLTMTPLQEVVNEAQAQKTYFHMAALGEGGVKMLSRQKKIDFTKIDFTGPGKARVETREVWDFAYHDITSGKKNEEKKDFVYLMVYTLEQSGGRWLITDTLASGDEKKAHKGEGR